MMPTTNNTNAIRSSGLSLFMFDAVNLCFQMLPPSAVHSLSIVRRVQINTSNSNRRAPVSLLLVESDNKQRGQEVYVACIYVVCIGFDWVCIGLGMEVGKEVGEAFWSLSVRVFRSSLSTPEWCIGDHESRIVEGYHEQEEVSPSAPL